MHRVELGSLRHLDLIDEEYGGAVLRPLVVYKDPLTESRLAAIYTGDMGRAQSAPDAYRGGHDDGRG